MKQYSHLLVFLTCKAKVKLRQGEVIEELHSHTHAPDTAKCEATKVLQEIKERAQHTEETTQQIIAEGCASISDEVATKLPSIHFLRRDVRRYKQKKRNYLPLPSSALDLVLPENYVKTTRGENFLLHDSMLDGKRMLIFGTTKSITFLKNHPHWCLDGTFKVVPEIIVQLYGIAASYHLLGVPIQ